MDDLSYQDITQQYLNNLVSYKGQIVYISRVFEDKRIKIQFMKSRLTDTVVFNRKDFSVIKSRLGMVNVYDSVVYMTRIPVRKMGIGLNRSNISVKTLPTQYPQGRADTLYCINSLTYEGICKTLEGDYPTFQQALHKAKAEQPATVAFDRQFAIDSDGTVYYKILSVGCLLKKGNTVSEIIFDKQYQHLSILLENNHEKTIGHSCS